MLVVRVGAVLPVCALSSDQQIGIMCNSSCPSLVISLWESSLRSFQPLQSRRMQCSARVSCLPRGPLGRGLQAPSPSAVLACFLSGGALSVSFASAPPQADVASHQPDARARRCGQWHWSGVRHGCQKQPNRSHPLHSAPSFVGSATVRCHGSAARVCTEPRSSWLAAYIPDPFSAPRSSSPSPALGVPAGQRQASVSFSPLSLALVAVSRPRTTRESSRRAPPVQRSPRPRLLLRPLLSPQPPRASYARVLAAKVGATRNGPCGETSVVVATQAQACQFRSLIGPSHGPGPYARRVGHRARIHRPQAHQRGARLRAHLPRAPAGHPHPVLRDLVVGPYKRVEPSLGLAPVILFLEKTPPAIAW